MIEQNPSSPDRHHKLFLLGGIILSVLLVFSAVTLATTRTSLRGRASESATNTAISLANSYVFASPLTALADGTSTIRITVFLLNNQGMGVGSTEVALKTTGDLKIEKVQATTDTFGRAIYDVTSTTPGSYTISAEAEGSALPQKVSISFQ